MRCPNCNNETAPGASFCKHCGARISVTSRCKKCGTPLDIPCGFCPRCGHDNSKSSSNNMMIVIIALLAVLILAVIASTAILLTVRNNRDNSESRQTVQTQEKDNAEKSADKSDSNAEKSDNNSDKSTDSKDSGDSVAANADTDKSENYEHPNPDKNTEKKSAPSKKSSRYNEFLERAAAIERYDNSLDYDYMPQVEINTSTYEVFKRWDDLLNEVYQYLKSTMSSSEFEKLKQDEQKWVAEKENAVDEAAAEWLGGSGEAMIRNGTAIQYTKDRCYYLISLTK